MLDSEDDTPADLYLLCNRGEAVVNLLYLIRLDRNNPDKVLGWVNLADEQVQLIAEILQRNLR